MKKVEKHVRGVTQRYFGTSNDITDHEEIQDEHTPHSTMKRSLARPIDKWNHGMCAKVCADCV